MNKKKIAGEKAAEFIKDGMTVGLGTGSTAKYLVEKVGEMVKNGLKIQAVATSKATEDQAKELGISLVDVNDVECIDIAIDGVDEIDRDFNATKGGGGALFREKIVASLANKVIWIMDDSKLVESIGEFPLPVEILPYGYKVTFKRLEALGYNPVMRLKNDGLFVTDNGNYIADLHIGAPADVDDIKQKLDNTVGVLETGQFLKMCDCIVVGTCDGARIYDAVSIIAGC
ncbi:MAG: ribose-5-phosphate isomerase RpiA [Lachnospiraceae bacterium]|nr:ribose-5-phosphate isomerase RpiA [Lachnospiraceae bacterium]